MFISQIQANIQTLSDESTQQNLCQNIKICFQKFFLSVARWSRGMILA